MLTKQQQELWTRWKHSGAPQRNAWIAEKIFKTSEDAKLYPDIRGDFTALVITQCDDANYHVRRLPRSSLCECVIERDGMTYTSPAMPHGEAVILSTLFMMENASDEIQTRTNTA